jgi:hypothetical protein
MSGVGFCRRVRDFGGDMSDLSQAQILAQFLLAWHRENGRREVTARLREQEGRQHYLDTLEDILGKDISQLETIREIATVQRNGPFEWAYTIAPPQPLWSHNVQSHYPELSPLGNFGQVAKMILTLLDSTAQPVQLPDPVDRSLYTLPAGWENGQENLVPHYARLRIQEPSGRSGVLYEYFSELSKLEQLGVGGREFLVTMNEDIQHIMPTTDEFVLAFDPASLGFQLASGEGTLVNALLHGMLSVAEVVIG